MRRLRTIGLSAALLLAPTTALAAGESFASVRSAELAIESLDALSSIHDPSCATSEVLRVQQAWASLPEASRRVANGLLPGAFSEGSGSVPRGTVRCDLELANVVESEHFSLQWGPGVSVSPETAEYLLAGIEEVRSFFLEAGYPEPAGNPDHRVPFYFGNSGGQSPTISFSGGYTTMCAESEHAYVVMSDMRADDGSVELATHELFHAIQMGGVEPYGVDGWYWEASATWSEELAKPDWNTYAWVLNAYTENTALPIADESVFLHRYGLFVFVAFLAEHSPGGLESVRHVWTAPGDALASKLNAFWEGLGERTDFAEQFGHFTARTAVMDYADHDTYMSAPVVPEGTLEPGEPLEEVRSPGLYGTHYYRVDTSAAGGDRTKLRVSFAGAEDRQWIVGTSRSPDGRTALSTQLYLDRQGADTVDLLDVGSTYPEAWVTVTRIGVESSTYDLAVELLDQTEDPGSDLDPDPPGSGGVACDGLRAHPFVWPTASLGGGASTSGFALLALLLLRRRR